MNTKKYPSHLRKKLVTRSDNSCIHGTPTGTRCPQCEKLIAGWNRCFNKTEGEQVNEN